MNEYPATARERAEQWAKDDGLLRNLAIQMLACAQIGCDWIREDGHRMCGNCRNQWDAAYEIERLRRGVDHALRSYCAAEELGASCGIRPILRDLAGGYVK